MLHIQCDTRRNKTYIACPKCQSQKELRRKELKMFLNFDKDMYRCAKCGDKASLTEGGPVAFWMLMKGIDNPKDAAKDFYRQRDGIPAEKRKEYKRPEPVPEKPPAPIEVRDHTYRCLFKISRLSPKHREALKAVRCLSDQDIDRLGYKSTPRDGKSAAAQLLKMGCTLDGVAPFYKDKDGTWTMRLYKWPGVMMPKLNAKGQIQSVEVCMDPGKDGKFQGAKYLPFSSDMDSDGTPLPCGTGNRVFCHFRLGARGLQKVVLTEGVLKADIISTLSGYSVLSISGVNSQQYLPGALIGLSNVDIFQGVYIAFDNDFADNPHVQKALNKLKATMDSYGIPYKDISGDWPKEYKGLDDYLIAKKAHNNSK